MSYISRIIIGRVLIGVALVTLAFAGRTIYAGSAAQAQSAVNTIDFAFEPAQLTVPLGTEVTWTNTGEQPHTATAKDNTFASGNLNKGQAFSFTFNNAGTYAYVCDYHPRMEGTITVAAAAAPSNLPSTGASDLPLSLAVLFALVSLAAGVALNRSARRIATP